MELNTPWFWEESSGMGRCWKYVFRNNKTIKLSPHFFLFCKHWGSSDLLSSSSCLLTAPVVLWPQKISQLPLSEQEQIKDFAYLHLLIWEYPYICFLEIKVLLKIHLAKWFSQPQGAAQEELQSGIQSSWWGCRKSRSDERSCAHMQHLKYTCCRWQDLLDQAEGHVNIPIT